jgi:levanase/fructan beta-fructosidase
MTIPSVFGSPVPQRPGAEPFRPQCHFSARRNWINDPNGLVYFDGEYHLFFQYNPEGIEWGHMSWGHAVSTDLLHWRELAVAIPETDQMIFSGSVVVDRGNVSGLGDGTSPPLLAYFTAFNPRSEIQSQHLAFSHDRGRTFTHYAGNPILDPGATDFRDPKVFYHDETKAWVMAVVRAQLHVVQFYRSENLLDWTLAGEFSGSGSVAGQWECPDLIRVGVDGAADQARWVLKIDVDVGLVAGGSGGQYFVGDFDGYRFSIDPQHGNPGGDLVDCGPDFYAAVTWSDLPSAQPGPVWVGWQSNHQSGKSYPTYPWRGAMSWPRALFLFQEAGTWRLGQRPIDATADLRTAATSQPPVTLDQAAVLDLETPGPGFAQRLCLTDLAAGEASLTIADAGGVLLTLAIDFPGRQLTFQRHESALCRSEHFARVTTTPLPGAATLDLDVICDGLLVEIFIAGGRRVYSASLFAQGAARLQVAAVSGTVRIDRMAGWTLRQSIDFDT